MVAETRGDGRTGLAPDVRADIQVAGLVGLGHTFSHFVLLAIPPLFPLIKRDLGLSYTELGLILTMANLGSGLFQLPFGFLVDRFGAVPVLLGGIALHASALFCLGLAPAYGIMLAIAFLIGLGNAVYHPADYAILSARISEKRVGRAFGVHSFTGYLGWALAPITMGFLATQTSWHVALMLAGAAGLAVALAIAAQRHHLDDAAQRAERLARRSQQQGQSLAVLKSRPVMLCFVFFVLAATGLSGLAAFAVSAFTAGQGISIEIATLAVTLFFVGSAIGVLTGGVIADRTHRHQSVALTGLLTSAALILLLTQPLPPFAILAVMGCAGFFNGLVMPSRDMIVRSVAPPGQAGKVFGMVSSGLDVGGVIMPLIFGPLLDHGMPAAVFVGSAIATALAALTVITTRSAAKAA